MIWTSRSSSGGGDSEASVSTLELNLQLLFGHAIEVVFLVRADATPDDEDFDSLRETVYALVSARSTSEQLWDWTCAPAVSLPDDDERNFWAPTSPTAAIEVLRAACHAFECNDVEVVTDRLNDLAESLDRLSRREVDGLDLDQLLGQLRSIHRALMASTAIASDEVLGLASI
jgi:hypothetical protein